MNHLSQNVKEIRERTGLTQEELSQKCLVTYSTITKIESGHIKNPGIDTIQNIANALNVEVGMLLEVKNPAKPFLKWAGGKRQLSLTIRKLTPEKYNTYFEPFLGGGAIFFELMPKNAVLADLNEELINTYLVVRDSLGELINELNNYKNTEDFYYETRKVDTTNLSNVQRAARLIFLNKTCFNGLFRVNKKGDFNVPFGHRKNVVLLDKENLQSVSDALKEKVIKHADYKDVLKNAKKGDFIYLDPPYYPAEGFADFKRYTKESFYEKDHVELEQLFAELVNKGCYVIQTNSNTNFIKKLYSKYQSIVVPSKRMINKNPNKRTSEDLIILGNIEK